MIQNKRLFSIKNKLMGAKKITISPTLNMLLYCSFFVGMGFSINIYKSIFNPTSTRTTGVHGFVYKVLV